MDPEQYADAVKRLEREYVDGGMTADEYTRQRRDLERRASTDESDSQPASSWEPMPPAPEERPTTHAGDVSMIDAALATWGRRAGGWFVDLLVYVGAFTATFVFALTTEDTTGEISTIAALLIFLVWFAGPTLYAWLMVGAWGQTLGKMAVGVKVVRSSDAGRVSFVRALGRAVSTWLHGVLFVPILLAYLWPLWDKRKQTLYDKMAGTIVVRVRRGGAPAD